MMKLIVLVLQGLAVFGKPAKRYFIASPAEVHTVVKRAANLNPGFSLSEFRTDQLNLHNHYRQLHGVPQMTLDNNLNSEAQSYAEYLAANDLFQHCGSKSCNPSNAGENLAFAGGHTSVETNATLRWYEEVLDYNYCSFPQGQATTRPGHEGKQVGHFTQVVWKTSTKLGIGYSRNSDRTKVYVVARYLSPGNFNGQYSNNVPKADYLLEIFQDNCNGVNGGFTDWSEPGPCTKTCGKGVRFEERTCTNPKPSFNGRDCSGETRRVVPYWCNSQACDSPVNERDEQCRKRGYEPKANNFGGSNECVLHCLDPSRSNFYVGRGNVDDGTHCLNSNGACIAGSCIQMRDEPPTTSPPSTTQSTSTASSTASTTTSAPQTTATAAPPTGSSTTPATTSPTIQSTTPPTTTSTSQPGTTASTSTASSTASTTTAAPQTTATAAPTTGSSTTPATTSPTIQSTTPPTTTSTSQPGTTASTSTASSTGSVVDGGFTDWSAPGECSKTCGAGISYQYRTCTNPTPSSGGKDCEGPTKRLVTVWCNPQPCDPPEQERNQQCQKRGYEADAHNFGGSYECTLHCKGSNSIYYFGRGAVDEGTHCNKNTGACVDNACVPMTYAPGTIIQGQYKRTLTSSYYNNIVVAIPNGATDVEITNNNGAAIVVVGYRSNYSFGYSTSSVVKGVSVTYQSSRITIAGPVNPTSGYQIVIYAIGSSQADIDYKYKP